ncbi:hypothetical protein [Nocardioides lijunqiniae]|uniref:hypothetical protein n=1 Tax=Nocardioides lijunqiniae TaxID=2760832 RepID=UPI0018781200|nr:hypothetical protein [Nocardioides lijunqiniae]
MSDALKVEDGRAPWDPVAGAEKGEVLDFYNIPRSGLLHANGLTYFFDCILGDGGSSGAWAYAHVDDTEMLNLLNAVGPAEYRAAAAAAITDRWVTVAAVAEYKIIESATFDAGSEGALGLSERLVKHWDRIMATRQDLRELVSATPH